MAEGLAFSTSIAGFVIFLAVGLTVWALSRDVRDLRKQLYAADIQLAKAEVRVERVERELGNLRARLHPQHTGGGAAQRR